VIPIIAHVLNRVNWEVNNIFKIPFEDIPLRITNIEDSVNVDTDSVFNTVLKWRLDVGK